MRHYVRGLAYAGKGDPAKAHVESDSVAAIMKALPPDAIEDLNPTSALLNAGNSPEAEVVYRAHLERHPNDPWGLNGLAQSLERQSKSAEAKEAQGKFTAGWATADVKLKGSKF